MILSGLRMMVEKQAPISNKDELIANNFFTSRPEGWKSLTINSSFRTGVRKLIDNDFYLVF